MSETMNNIQTFYMFSDDYMGKFVFTAIKYIGIRLTRQELIHIILNAKYFTHCWKELTTSDISAELQVENPATHFANALIVSLSTDWLKMSGDKYRGQRWLQPYVLMVVLSIEYFKQSYEQLHEPIRAISAHS